MVELYDSSSDTFDPLQIEEDEQSTEKNVHNSFSIDRINTDSTSSNSEEMKEVDTYKVQEKMAMGFLIDMENIHE